MTLSVKITGKIEIPELDLTDTLMKVANRDVIGRLAKNIQRGISLNEREYPALDPKTIKRKGHARPLIETGKLHSSFKAVKKAKNRILVRINTERRKIAKFLQIDGVRTKSGKRRFNFFGVSQRMESDGNKRMEKEIKQRIKNAR